MNTTEIPAELRELSFLDLEFVAGVAVVSIAMGLVALEILSLYRPISLLKMLDKAGLASRVRNLIRATALLSWLSTAVGIPVVAGAFLVMLQAHVSAAIIQRVIDTIYKSRPAQPVANLKIKKRYDKVWQRLPELKRRRARVLYGFDMWLTLGILVIFAVNRIPVFADRNISSAGISIGFLVVTAAFIALATAKTRLRQQSFQKSNVAATIEAKLVAELKKHKPQVLLYFTGARADRYQLEQWLKPVDKLKLKTMIVVREPSNGKKFPGCKWPVIVAPTVAQLEKVTDLPSLKTVIYASNAAKNMHMLRNGKLKHVYLNHGDSDKKSSANPYSRVYDVVLVAGPAGKKRYLDIGFDGQKPAIVEIGRPQLDALASSSKKSVKKGTPSTVLYAPTWEGVASSVNYTSLTTLGVGLAEAAAATQTHKLIVKLHPNTGRFDKKMDVATEQIKSIAAQSDWVELVDKSNDLYKLFASADVLVSDVSAVVSDFLCTDRPLVMTLPPTMTKAEYLKKFPIGKAATMVPADDGKAAFKSAVAVIKKDPQSSSRMRTKASVHGNHPKGSQHAFNVLLARVVAGKPALAEPKVTKVEKAKKAPKKVLISLNSLQAGGAERDCLELSTALSDAGHSVTVYAQHGDLRQELDSRVTYLERPADHARAAQILREVVSKFDVVNTHDLRSLAALSKVGDRPPVLAIVHNINARRYDGAARWLLRNVPDEVVFVSESERKRVFKRRAPVGTVIHPSIGYATGFVEKLKNVKPDVDTILFCGRLSRERGPDLAIKALPKLSGKTLVIVGDGPMKQELISLAGKLGVSSQVKMVGAVSDPYPYIASAGAVVVPSRRDALPRIVREAAALGRPIVAAESPGTREAAADYRTIRFCDPKNIDEFVACVYDMLSVRGQQHAKQGEPSSWKPILQKFEELEARGRQQTERKQKQRAQKVLSASSKLLSDRYEQQKQRYLDRVDQVIGNQNEQPRDAASEIDGWEQQRQNAGTQEAKRPDIGVVDIEEDETSPERSTDDRRFDEKVGGLVQPSAKLAGLVAPPGELSVSTISQQIDLGSDNRSQGRDNVGAAHQSDSCKTSRSHQAGDHVLMNDGISNSPRKSAGDAPSVKPASPMLTLHSGRPGSSAKLGETDRMVDVVALQDLNTSSNEYQKTEIGDDRVVLGEGNVDFSSNGADPGLSNSVLGLGNKNQCSPCQSPPVSIRKPKDGIFATYVGAPIAEYLVRSHLGPRNISPNQVTFASTCFSALGARLVASRNLGVKLVGAGTLGFGFVLDCADGQLARLTGTERDSGMVFDELSDRASELILIRQLHRASNSKYLGDAATVLLLTRHILSRLPQTKIIPLEDREDIFADEPKDPLRRDGSLVLPFGEMVMTASHLTIGERLAITTAASIVSARFGVSTHATLGLLGLSRDIATRQIRATELPRSAEVVAAASIVAGLFISRKYPGRMPILAVGPYILLAYRRLELNHTLESFVYQAADKNRETK